MQKSRLFLIPFLFLFTACDKDDGGSPQVQKVLVTGDPMTFIKETSLDKTSGIPLSLFEDGEKWTFHTIGFVTRPQIKIESQEQAEINQAPTSEEQTESLRDNIYEYRLKSIPTSEGQVVNFDPLKTKNPYRFVFEKRADRLVLKTIKALNQLDAVAIDFQVQHYSVKANEKSFSLLFSFVAEGSNVLIAYYFSKATNQPFLQQVLDKAYNFFWGPGVNMAWDQKEPLNMTICNRGAGPFYSDLTKAAIDEWAFHLENRLKLTSSIAEDLCPPFSDLNSHTVFHVNDWIQVEGAAATLAFVPPIPDYSRSKIIDGDIFLLEGEWNENLSQNTPGAKMSAKNMYEDQKLRSSYKSTMKHEFGHVLGLGHEFDEYSVMSYDNVDAVTTFDQKFVGELYPKVEGL